MSFGIAFAGGGTRGAAHVGVLKALEQNGLFPSSIAGSSAGSVVAGLYASGVNINELENIVYDLAKKKKKIIDPNYIGLIKAILEFCFFKTPSLSGILKGVKWEKYISEKIQCVPISKTKIPIVIPTVDVKSGKTVVYTSSLDHIKEVEGVIWDNNINLCDAIRASTAVPSVFCPKVIGERCLVDGSVTDVLPVDLLRAAGEKNILAVDISANYTMPKSNNLIDVTSHCFNIMGTRLRELISSSEQFLLHPNLPQKAGLLTFDYMIECMECGYQATINAMPKIKSIFN